MARAYLRRRRGERLEFYADVSTAVWGDKKQRREYLKGLTK